MKQHGLEAVLGLINLRVREKEIALAKALARKTALAERHRCLVTDRQKLTEGFGGDEALLGTHAFANARRRKLSSEQTNLQPELARAAMAAHLAREDLQAERRREVGVRLFLEKQSEKGATREPAEDLTLLILAKQALR